MGGYRYKLENYIAAIDAGYFSTDDGRIFSSKSNWRGMGTREIKQATNFGYKRFRAVIDGKRIKLFSHKLVAIQHIGLPPTEKHQVRHIDGSRDNNFVSNLCWGTVSENALDRGRHGTQYIPDWSNSELRRKMTAWRES